MTSFHYCFFQLILFAAFFATPQLKANFYTSRPCMLIELMQTQPASNQAMRIYADHLGMNGHKVHAEWLRLALTIDDIKQHAPKDRETLDLYEAKQKKMLEQHTNGSGNIDEFAKKYFKPLAFVNPYDYDLSHNFVRFDLSKENPAVFTMGEGKEAHEVTLTEPFEVSKYLTTQLEYTLVMRAAPYEFKDRATTLVHGLAIDPFRPAENVSWDMAQAFFARLNEIELTKPEGQQIYRYFLLSEAQWEFVARAGSADKYFFGQDPAMLPEYAWFDNDGNGPNRTMPVGQKKPNPNEMYDTLGNVWEWVADGYDAYPKGPAVNPKGPVDYRYWVCRGGSWYSSEEHCRSARRDGNLSRSLRNFDLGFRVARSPIHR